MAELHRLDPQPFLDAPRAQGAAIDIPGMLDRLTATAAELDRADLTQAAAWLAGHRPAAAAPVVCHGDLHPFNLLVSDNDHWTLLDWTTAVIADPAHDLAFTTLLLRHPPLTAPGPLQPVIQPAGRYAPPRLAARCQANGRPL